MKHILLRLIIVILSCVDICLFIYAQKINQDNTLPVSTTESSPIVLNNFDDKQQLVYIVHEYEDETDTFHKFEEIGAHAPSEIDMFVGKGNNHIGFIWAIDWPTNDFPSLLDNTYPKNLSDTALYLYYGVLTEVAPNVYTADGNYPSDWSALENSVSNDIDFYIVLKNNGLYFFFDPIDPQTIFDSIITDPFIYLHSTSDCPDDGSCY